jgi:hypothetical protein
LVEELEIQDWVNMADIEAKRKAKQQKHTDVYGCLHVVSSSSREIDFMEKSARSARGAVGSKS